MASERPVVHVRTYSAHHRKASDETLDYIRWYKAEEQPQLSDEANLAGDDIRIDLIDFRARFDKTARVEE